MLELTFEDVELVSGARRAAAEACLVMGGAIALGGSFFSPVGAAIGISLYTSPLHCSAAARNSLTFNELPEGLVNFGEIAFTL